jgi:hypothetical protein
MIVQFGFASDNNPTIGFPQAYVNSAIVQLTATGPTGPFAVSTLSKTGFNATCIGHPNTGGFFWEAWGT